MLALVGSTAIRHVESHHATNAALAAKNAIIAKISTMPVMVSFMEMRLRLTKDIVPLTQIKK
jgi:hypothetical protein